MDSQANRGGESLARISLIDRLDALVSHPKRLVAAIVALLVAAGTAVGSSAVLTSSSTNPGNSFAASNLSVTHDGNGVILDVSGLLPNQSTLAQPFIVRNNGDLPATMSLSMSPSDSPGPNGGNLSSVLKATIVDTTTGTTVYDNLLATSMGVLQLDADPGTPGQQPFGPSDAHTYTVELNFPSAGTPTSNTTEDNRFQLSSATLRYDWTGTQVQP